MTIKDKITFTGLTTAVAAGLIYLIKPVLAPFICAFIIAYLLNPLVDYLDRKFHFSRLLSTSLILGLFLVAIIAIGIVFFPIIYSQTSALIEAIPNYLQTIINDFYPRIAVHLNKFGFKMAADFSHLIEEEKLTTKFVDLSQNIFDGAITSSIAIINIISLIFITPLLVFYLLKDWDIFIKKIYDFLPRSIAQSAQNIAAEIHKTLASYLRGQLNVCLILSFFYSIALSFAKLNFGFLIGLATGLLCFIPYVGISIGITITIIVALFQWGFDLTHIGIIAAIFACGQTIEANFLIPKLIGSKIGLHPVWIIFGLFVFGIVFGFIGVLTAVPLTAICGVIVKHFATEYKKRFT